MPLQQPDPQPEVDEVVVVEVGRDRALQPVPRRRQVAPDEGPADEQLDGLRDLVLVARRRRVSPLERALGRLHGAEPVEHPREDPLDAGARIGVLHVPRRHELLERVGQRRAGSRGVALRMRHVAHQRRISPRRAGSPATSWAERASRRWPRAASGRPSRHSIRASESSTAPDFS